MTVAAIDRGIETVLNGYDVDMAKAAESASRIHQPDFYRALGQLQRVVPQHLVPLVIRNGEVLGYIGRPEFARYLGLAGSVNDLMRRQGIQLNETNVGVLNSIEMARDYCIAAQARIRK